MIARASSLAVALVLLALGQDEPSRSFKRGRLTVLFHADELELRIDSAVRHVKFAKLPIYASDCEDPANQEDCAARKNEPCVACIGTPGIIAWDEARQMLYFQIRNGTGRNFGWILLSYDVQSGRVRRIAAGEGAGVSLGAVSPSGRYLAYASFFHCGMCCNFSVIEVVDLRSRRHGLLSNGVLGDLVTNVQEVRWNSDSELEYDVDQHSDSECQAHPDNFATRQLKRQLKVSELDFK